MFLERHLVTQLLLLQPNHLRIILVHAFGNIDSLNGENFDRALIGRLYFTSPSWCSCILSTLGDENIYLAWDSLYTSTTMVFVLIGNIFFALLWSMEGWGCHFFSDTDARHRGVYIHGQYIHGHEVLPTRSLGRIIPTIQEIFVSTDYIHFFYTTMRVLLSIGV